MNPAVDKSRAVEHYTREAALAAALTLSRKIESITLWPYVITVREAMEDGRQVCVAMEVAQGTAGNPPDPMQFVPAGIGEHVIDMLPASRFASMPEPMRNRYSGQYAAYLKWRAAKARGLDVRDMQAGVDYDARDLDDRVSQWVRPSSYFAGD